MLKYLPLRTLIAFTLLMTSSAFAQQFTPLERSEIDALIKKLPPELYLVKDFLKDPHSSWSLHKGDLTIKGPWANSEGIIVEGDLKVEGSYDDYRPGIGRLIVFGDMSAENIVSWGSITVTGKLSSPGLVYAYYNDFIFEVSEIEARAFVTFDKSTYVGRDKSHFSLRGDRIQERKDIERALRIFVPEVMAPSLADLIGGELTHVTPDYDRCRDLIWKGSSVFRLNEGPESIADDVAKIIAEGTSSAEIKILSKKDPLLTLLAEML